VESGIGTPEDVQRAAEVNHGLGIFVRSLVGLDRSAAKDVFASFLEARTLNANQIEFVNMIIDHLTENGAMDPRLDTSPNPETKRAAHAERGVRTSSQFSLCVRARGGARWSSRDCRRA
jgi:type I restriction enzyme R subunit